MRPEHTVADILEMERLQLKSMSLTPWHYRALQAIRRCRTKAMGGHIDKCDHCHRLHISYNSCRNRHCPTCQGHKREEWIRSREDELLNVPYFHVVFTLRRRLWREGLVWENCVADTGYSSGENYAFLEDSGIKSFIPPHGTYKGGPDNFIYNENEDHYLCPQGKVIPFKKVFLDSRTKTRKKAYRASSKICKGCPLRTTCLGKVNEKQFSVTYYRAEYERNIERVNSREGRYMKGKRQSTVEPVFGTLTQFMGLRKINTIGIGQANKVMHLSAIAYNLKKYLKFEQKRVKSGAVILASGAFVKSVLQNLFSATRPRRKIAFRL